MDVRRGLRLLALALLLAACGGEKENGRLTIAVIPKGTSHEFWKSIHAGAVKAERELGDGVKIVWRGPEREDDRAQQIDLVQNFVGAGADAIVLAPLDDQALVGPVRLATREGTPVVIIDSGLAAELGKDYVAYIATDNHQGGFLCGEELARRMDGRGEALLLRYMEGSASTTQREAGFLEAMKAHPGITVVDPGRYAGASRDSARAAAENLLTTHPGVTGIFCSNESATAGMLLALETHRMAGKKSFVGFDASERLVEALKKGTIQALAVQDPFTMGYRGVKTAVAKLRSEPIETHQDTGVTLVTQENMDDPDVQRLLHPPLDQYLGR